MIAIIAILAAILFPVFAKAREKARQSSCLSNAKQLALAEMQYEQDYDEMTASYSSHPGAVAAYTWYEMLTPYIKNSQVFKCPSYSGPNARSYGPNITSVGTASSAGPTCYYLYAYRSAASFKLPAETILISESSNNSYVRFNTLTAPVDGLVTPHNDGANAAFFDGHAKWLSVSALNNPTAQPIQWRGGL